ncbi:MAG: sigma-70 family RNA polymerase sigma factor, partial [Polyangiaceae bacterium]
MCRDQEDAKDVLQDTLLSVARNVRDFRGSSSISTWLYSVSRSFCVKKRRKSKFAPKEVPSSLDSTAEQVVDSGKTADEAIASKQIERALEEAIGALEPMYREVLLLRDVEGLHGDTGHLREARSASPTDRLKAVSPRKAVNRSLHPLRP